MTAMDDPYDEELELKITANLSMDSLIANQPDTPADDKDPKTLQESMTCPNWPEWQEAMDEEIRLMEKYEVWEEVETPEDTNIVGCRWVFHIKQDSNCQG